MSTSTYSDSESTSGDSFFSNDSFFDDSASDTSSYTNSASDASSYSYSASDSSPTHPSALPRDGHFPERMHCDAVVERDGTIRLPHGADRDSIVSVDVPVPESFLVFLLCCSASGEDGAKRLYPIVHLRRVIRSYVVATPTTVSEDVFAKCSSLASITLPESVTTLGDGAFYLSLIHI